jgi:hypothetical protein
MTKRALHIGLTLLIATGARAAFAAVPAAWSPDDIHVSRSISGEPGSAASHFEIAQNGDARITIERREKSTHATGTIVMIGGRWMLTQGFAGAPGKELESLDLAVLNSQLVVVLLTAALPEGAPTAGPPQHVRFAEKTNPIRIATATSATEYLAPWTVVGSVTVPAAGAEATYQLSFTYSDQGLSRTMDFAGSVGNARSPLDFPDSMKLAGWKIRRLPQSVEASLTAAAPGSAPHPGVPQPATLGKLRQLN